jgi:hypothetical protein
MHLKVINGLVLLIILVGIGFSGFLTAGSLHGSCPVEGGCAAFFGYPVCMYGFLMYLLVLIFFVLTWGNKIAEKTGKKIIAVISVIGMIFAGSVLYQEYSFGEPLSVCAAGFAMYLLIFLLTLAWWKKK